MPATELQAPKIAYKPKKSIKSPAIKAAVVTRRVQGQDKRQIAKDLGIARMTVDSILNEANLDQQMESGALQSVRLIPEALRVAEFRLACNSETMAIETLRNTIWPLNGKNAKGMKAGDNLFLSIQNLIQPTSVKPVESTRDSVPRDALTITPTE